MNRKTGFLLIIVAILAVSTLTYFFPSRKSEEGTPPESQQPEKEAPLLWTVPLQNFVPQYFEGTLFCVSDNEIKAFDGGTGALKWSASTESFIVSFDYTDSTFLIAEQGLVVAFNAQTGEEKWERSLGGGEYCSKTGKYLVAENGVAYVGTPTPSVYCLEAKDGTVVWDYSEGLETCPQFKIIGERLLVHSMKVVCLKKKTGEYLWEFSDYAPGALYYEGIMLLNAVDKTGHFFYALVDEETGEVLWQESSFGIPDLGYKNGLLYLNKARRLKRFDIHDVKSGYTWQYEHGKEVATWTEADKGIVILLYTQEGTNYSLDSLVLVNNEGSVVWEHQYEGIEWNPAYKAHLEVLKDEILVLREGGYIEAFSKDGVKKWETKIQETSDHVMVQGDTVLITAQDGIYCLNTKGFLLWEYHTGVEKDSLDIFEINDGKIFVAGTQGIYVFSL